MKYKKNETEENIFILQCYLQGKATSDIARDIENKGLRETREAIRELKKRYKIEETLNQVRKRLTQDAIAKTRGSFVKSLGLLKFDCSRHFFNKVIGENSLEVKKSYPKTLITCQNCINEGNPQDIVRGQPCKAIESGIPADDDNGNCIYFEIIDQFFVKGASQSPETGFTRLRGQDG